MIYPRKVCPVKHLQRLLDLTLLKDFNTLLEVFLIKGLKNKNEVRTLLKDYNILLGLLC